MGTVFNRYKENIKRRSLRRDMPRAEIILWSRLKNKQLNGFKFRRQYSVGPYIVDFYCPCLKLVIEVDGDSHFRKGAYEYDRQREKYIEQFGVRFLRFTNLEVYNQLNDVLDEIVVWIEENK